MLWCVHKLKTIIGYVYLLTTKLASKEEKSYSYFISSFAIGPSIQATLDIIWSLHKSSAINQMSKHTLYLNITGLQTIKLIKLFQHMPKLHLKPVN